MSQLFRKRRIGMEKRFASFVLVAVACIFFSAHVLAQEIPDPCPMPEQLAKESPPDMATVQSDIDILKLCVERANLLKELNNLVVETRGKNEDDGGGLALTGNSGSSAANNFDQDNFEPVEADLFDLPDEEEPEDFVVEEVEPQPQVTESEDKVVDEDKKPVITNIFGKN